MERIHDCLTHLKWTGNLGTGTSDYRGYRRDYDLRSKEGDTIKGSSDPTFLGDPKRYNPEELLVASVSSCHMLWYLHLCASQGVVVVSYEDDAQGRMIERKNGAGAFESVQLVPKVAVAKASMIDKAIELHVEANRMCFIANSLNFRVEHHPEVWSVE